MGVENMHSIHRYSYVLSKPARMLCLQMHIHLLIVYVNLLSADIHILKSIKEHAPKRVWKLNFKLHDRSDIQAIHYIFLRQHSASCKNPISWILNHRLMAKCRLTAHSKLKAKTVSICLGVFHQNSNRHRNCIQLDPPNLNVSTVWDLLRWRSEWLRSQSAVNSG